MIQKRSETQPCRTRLCETFVAMIIWCMLFTTASSALLVSGNSVFSSAREESEGPQWQLDMERFRSQMQQWFQNALNDYQRTLRMSPFGGVFNLSSMMDTLPAPFQPRGAQSNLSATVERSAQSEGSSNYSSWIQSPDNSNGSSPPPPGQATISELRHHAHAAAQFGREQDTPGGSDQPESFEPSRGPPGLFPGGPKGTGRPRRGRGPWREFPPGQRRRFDVSSEESQESRESREDFFPGSGRGRPGGFPDVPSGTGWPRRDRGPRRDFPNGQRRRSDVSSEESRESRESREDFFPGSGQGRPGGFPGRRMPGWNTGRWNRRLRSRPPPDQNSSEESQSGQNMENSQGSGQRGRFPPGVSPPGRFPRPTGPPGFFSPGQPDLAQPTGVPPGLGDYRSGIFSRLRQPANQTPFDQSRDGESFLVQQPPSQEPAGQSSSSKGSSFQAVTWPSLFSRGQRMPSGYYVGNSPRQGPSGANFQGQFPPVGQPSGQPPPGQRSFGNSEWGQGPLGQPSSSQNARNRFPSG